MLSWWILFAGIGVAGTWLARRYALHSALLDHPGERRSHAVPTPRGGGIAIVAALLVAAVALGLREPAYGPLLFGFALSVALVAAVGLVDDHRPLSPWLRLRVHAVAAGVFTLALALVFGNLALALLGFALLLALTNIWNFMDGINGLAGSQALLLGVALAPAGGVWGLLAAALAAACLGFLPLNFPQARIFMGDVGSGAVGFAIAALALVAYGMHGPAAWVLLLPLSAFLVDSGLTLFRRVLRGERWWTPHTQHAYQVWARRVGHTRVTLAYGAWTVVAGGLAYWFRDAPVGLTWIVCLSWYMTAVGAWWILQRIGRRADR